MPFHYLSFRMRNLFTIIFLTFIGFASAQEADSLPGKKIRRLYISASFSPDYCFRTLTNHDGSSMSSYIVNLRNGQEIPKFGYGTGINLIYKFKGHFEFESGVQYADYGFATNVPPLTFANSIDPNRGFVYNSISPTIPKFFTNFNYLDIPLRANFVCGKRRFHFIASAGVVTNILATVSSTSVEDNADGSKTQITTRDNRGYNGINISPVVSVGVEYRVCKRFLLRAEPTFQRGILPTTYTPVEETLWNAGVNFSLLYRL